MNLPKVSIICLCYNHKSYIEEAIRSAFHQNYDNLEIIALDDCSTDGSHEVLLTLARKYPSLRLILNSTNLGNCASFNKAFALSTGDYIIDLAADDILLPERVSIGVAELETQPNEVGVHYSDHEWIDYTSKSLGYQYERDEHGGLINRPPSGDIYTDILERYFISAPTMLIKREVLDQLGGYDESLTYEDFDFWVRSSRNWRYHFSDKVLVKKRILEGSLSTSQFRFASGHDRSTYAVCVKALELNRNEKEHNALKGRLSYERKHALANGNLKLAKDYHVLIQEVKKHLARSPT
jgi:glycosyltransferase involved in cell wall biosynthesis